MGTSYCLCHTPPIKKPRTWTNSVFGHDPCQSINCLSFLIIKGERQFDSHKLSLSSVHIFFDSWASVEILPCDRGSEFSGILDQG